MHVRLFVVGCDRISVSDISVTTSVISFLSISRATLVNGDIDGRDTSTWDGASSICGISTLTHSPSMIEALPIELVSK